jgi:hypothetical protein
MAALCLCAVYLIPWLWKAPSALENIFRVLSATILVIIAVGQFGFWVTRPNATRAPNEATIPAVAKAGPPPPASAFDNRPSEWRLENKPDDLVLRDLFLTDFKSVQQRAYGAVFVDDNKQISVQYSINVEPALRTKFLSFYIGRQDQHTAEICEYLSGHYQWILDNAPQLQIEQKNPGDSGTTSTKEAVFSGRVFVYHETYLPAEVTVKLTETYKTRGVSAIFRSTDYLSTKKMEANILKLRKEQHAN